MKKFFPIIIILFLLLPNLTIATENIADDLSGRILLQVESKGEAWYVNPLNLKRYYLGRPNDAFELMRKLGLGISNKDLSKIPTVDGSEKFQTDKTLRQKLSGRILLQVESKGEAWYVNPLDLKRYYLGRPQDAFKLMRSLGIGITNANLNKIIALTPAYQKIPIEKDIFNLINQERQKDGEELLTWNDELAAVAREHSQNLAEESEQYTGIGYSCDYPFIHHEGTVFGLYNSERLNNRNIYYFSKSGENIALIPSANFKAAFTANDPIEKEMQICQAELKNTDAQYKAEVEGASSNIAKLEILQNEKDKRQNYFLESRPINIVEINWRSEKELAQEAVNGWMNSAGHRRNILDGDFTESGVGIANVNGYMIATQVFIKRVGCGFKLGACCEKEGYYPYCFTPLKCEEMICR